MNMNKVKLKVGFVSLAKPNFDMEDAKQVFLKSVKMLKDLGIEVIKTDELITDSLEIDRVVAMFKEESIDVVIIQNGTFAGGEFAANLVKEINVHIVLWAIKEPLFAGGKPKFNSLCGANLNASLLIKMGKRFKFLYGNPDDKEIFKFLSRFLKVISATKQLKKTRLGLVGYRAPGFYNIAFDEMSFMSVFGIEIHHVDLAEVFWAAEKVPDVKKELITKEIKAAYDNITDIPQAKIEKSANAYAAFRQVIHKYNLDGLAIKCWPEFINLYELAICSTLSKLNDDGFLSSCEADTGGLLTMFIHKYLSGEIPFLADLISVDEEKGVALFWHCGSAPFSLAADTADKILSHNIGKGLGLNSRFPLKEGRVTISSLASVNNKFKMLIAGGEAIKTNVNLDGTPQEVKIDNNIKGFFNTVIYGGFGHHFSVIYQDLEEELIEFCNVIGIEAVTIT